jgi:D-alanine-D-alanine ligase
MVNRKIKVAVLMGGPSSEHDISIKSGVRVLAHLDRAKFEPMQVVISRDGEWPISLQELQEQIDVAFIAMHGEYGEDGQIQSILETFGIPYTGSDPIASALAMDKTKSSILFTRNGLLTPESLSATKDDPYITWAVTQNFQNPVVIKPANRGSSIGVSIVRHKNNIPPALTKAFQHSDHIIAQRHIQGNEVTCGVLEINKVPIPLVPTEVIPNAGEFFDYHAKYNTQGSIELTPPNLPQKTIRNIQMTALKAHKLLGCSGMSRTDMILDKNGNIYVLETNTIPGLTETSLLPQQAAKMGIEFKKLLEIIINSALNK